MLQLALFNKWEEELQVRKEELEKKIAALSPEAKEAYEGWKKLRLQVRLRHPNISDDKSEANKCIQEKLYLAELPKEIREELRSLCGWRKRDVTATDAPLATTTEDSDKTMEVSDF